MLRSNPREAAFLTVKKAQTMALDEVEDDDREYVAGAKQHVVAHVVVVLVWQRTYISAIH